MEINYWEKVPREKWQEIFDLYKTKYEKVFSDKKTVAERMQLLGELKKFSDFLLEKYGKTSSDDDKMEKYRKIFMYHVMIGSGVNPDEMEEFDFYEEDGSIRKFIDDDLK